MENHSNINNQFIPYNLALELKKLGFDEPCFGCYDYEKELVLFQELEDKTFWRNKNIPECEVASPLFQQAFDWFLKRGYFADIKPDLIMTSFWSYRVVDINAKYNPENLHRYRFVYYSDARLECLKKLIELRKNVK